MIMHGATPVREVVIHTSATPANWHAGKTAEQMRDEIRRQHTSPPNNWRDIGYHWVIAPDGTRAPGRLETTPGAHVKGRNTGTLGVCLVPVAWVDRMGTFEDWYTPEQKASLRRLLREIARRADIQTISGHNQYANKLCPGFDVHQTGWLSPEAIRSGVWHDVPPRADHVPATPAGPQSLLGALIDAILSLFRR